MAVAFLRRIFLGKSSHRFASSGHTKQPIHRDFLEWLLRGFLYFLLAIFKCQRRPCFQILRVLSFPWLCAPCPPRSGCLQVGISRKERKLQAFWLASFQRFDLSLTLFLEWFLLLLLFAWFSLDFLGESYYRIRIVLLIHRKAAELIEWTMVNFFEMCSPFINEIKCFNCLYIQFLTGLKYIIYHDCFLSLEILKIAACCYYFFKR